MSTERDGIAGIIIKPGQRVAFLGASITEFGWDQPGGYLRLVVECLAANGVAITPIPAGIGGNTSSDMLARIDRDIIAHRPDWMTVDAGRNDVWHGTGSLDRYRENMTAIVNKAQAAGIRVILQTITPIGEEQDNDLNAQLADYNAFVRDLAGQKGCLLAELNEAVVEVLKTKPETETGHMLTVDGTHMNDRGNRVMAAGLLKAMGLTDAQIAKTIAG